MKKYDSRTNGISDFIEWESAGKLQLSPKFQRRSVWNPKAKSYLMDTIIRGKPIPKVFIRQILNVTTKTSIREIVDGQQRLRTILSYVKDGFVILRSHNKDYGGILFSDLPAEVQGQILSYEVSVDLLINLPDAEILDIFGRLNSYAVTLNEQEKLNAQYFGPFKLLADEIGRELNEYWIQHRIFSANDVLRMKEVNLTADLLIALLEGIKAKRQVTKYYHSYEKEFDYDVDALKERFFSVISFIEELFPNGLKETEFKRSFLFYTLFTSVAHCLAPIPRLEVTVPQIGEAAALSQARNNLERVEVLFQEKDVSTISKEEREFLQDSRRATTDETVRTRRTNLS
ncbi:GmrSD restriction endonuclease domain-containing protein [Methylobacterium sp. CM6244]